MNIDEKANDIRHEEVYIPLFRSRSMFTETGLCLDIESAGLAAQLYQRRAPRNTIYN